MVVLARGEEESNSNEVLVEDLRGGDEAQFRYSIGQIHIQDGEVIRLPSPGVTAIVGGNNVGKSTLLRQLRIRASTQPGASQPVLVPRILASLESIRKGDVKDLAAWMMKHANLGGTAERPAFYRYGAEPLNPQLLTHYWASGDQLGPLASHLIHYSDARSRPKWTDGIDRRADFTNPPTHPNHIFEFDPARCAEISQISELAFGYPLTVDRLSGRVFFRVGSPSCDSPLIDQPTIEYQEQMAQLPPLNEQGDGMVFMLGALIPIVAAVFPVVLIDEPEAFLHPPQAYLMGRALGDLAQKRHLQVILATHDRNILRGLLSVREADVSLLRLTRVGKACYARLLPVDQVREISGDNFLRHTNILEGLFHRVVILVENERDCRFYTAALENLHDVEPEASAIAPHDVLFFSTHGKDTMARVANVLRGTGLPVVASPDLDVLDNRTVLRNLFISLGGEWDSEMEELYKRTAEQFRGPRVKRLNRDVRNEIDGILDEEPDAYYDNKRSRRVRTALRAPDPWSEVRDLGERAMTADRSARRRLLDRLDAVGLVSVREGQLENFDCEAPKGKNAWLPAALEHGAYAFPAAVSHMRRLLNAVEQRRV